MEGLLGPFPDLHDGQFCAQGAPVSGIFNQPDQGDIQAYKHPGVTNGIAQRSKQPDDGGDCWLHGQAVRLQEIHRAGTFQVLVGHAT